MNNTKDSIDAELATLDKLLEISTTSTPIPSKKQKLSTTDNECNFTDEIDKAFVEFNQIVTDIYKK